MCYPAQAGDAGRHVLKARNVAALPRTSRLPVRAVWSCRVSSIAAVGRRSAHSAVLRSRCAGSARIPPNFVSGSVVATRPSPAPDAAVDEADVLDHSTFADWSVDTTTVTVGEVADRVLAEIGDWPGTGNDGGDSSPTVDDVGIDARGEVLWLCGTTGVGKSTVGYRVYVDVLRSGIPAAYVDVDQVGLLQHRSERRSSAELATSLRSGGTSTTPVHAWLSSSVRLPRGPTRSSTSGRFHERRSPGAGSTPAARS